MSSEDLPRARTGRPRNLARRKIIVKSALASFASHGYDGASMHMIASASGIGDSLIFRYYRTKQMLLEDVIAYVIDEIRALREQLHAIAMGAGSLRTFVVDAASMLVGFFEDLTDWYAVRFTELPISGAQWKELNSGYDGVLDILACAVRNVGPTRDASVVARVLLGSVFTYVMFQKRTGHEPLAPALRETFVDELVELLMHGIEGAADCSDCGSAEGSAKPSTRRSSE